MNEDCKDLGIVVFFERNDNDVFDCVGQTQPMRFFTALEVYANTPNPASQLVDGNTVEEVTAEANKIIEQMKDPKYVQEYVDPYL